MITEFRQVDSLSPDDFEIFVRDVFVAAGWTDAIITKVGQQFQHGDGGVDIFASKSKRKFAIEVKQRGVGITVDISALNQLVTGAKLADVKNMILVTNSYFTSEVRVRALRLGVELIDRDALQNLWIEKHSEIGREIKPRLYQESVIDESMALYRDGKRRLLIEMATGLGKTYTVAHLVKRLLQEGSAKRVLFLAHQVEILLQSVTAFKNVLGIGTYSFSACFGGSAPEHTDFVFGSFDTLFSKIDSIAKDHFDIVIVDEAHHTPARTYSTVVSYFHPRLLVGLTATPFREDNKDVQSFFGGGEGHVGKYDLAWALRHNKLATPKYHVLLDDLDQSRIDQLDKGMSIKDLDQKLFLHKRDEEVVRIIEDTVQMKSILDPKGIVFCRSIAHINHLIQFFPAGSATFVHSQMTDTQRWANIRDFREGGYRYILVRDLFNEGIDIPETNLLIFMRYTGSQTVWLQQLGRGLRKTPNKDCVHILDFVGSLERLNEVQQLAKRVSNAPVDERGWEPDQPKIKGVIHNSSLEVEYSESAAQVLRLIEEHQLRINTRSQVIDAMRVYYEFNRNIPSIDRLQDAIHGITIDQISTLFDSYCGYLQAALPGKYDEAIFRSLCVNYANEFFVRNGIYPTPRATSQSTLCNGLLAVTESEAKGFLEEIDFDSTDIQYAAPLKDSSDIDDDNERALIDRYRGIIRTRDDLKSLSAAERDEIKCVFRSELRLLARILDGI